MNIPSPANFFTGVTYNTSQMWFKSFKSWFSILLLVCLTLSAFAGRSIDDTYVIIDSGSGSTYYQGGSGNSFDTKDFGTVTTFTLKGGEIKSCTDQTPSTGSINIYWRVFAEGCTGGSWSSAVNIPDNQTASHGCGGGDTPYKHDKTNYSIDMMSGLADGDYILEIIWRFQDNSGQVWEANDGCGNDCHLFSGVSGWDAEFTVGSGGSGAVTANTGTVDWSSTGSWVGSALPGAGANVVIPSSCTMTLDQDDEVGSIEVSSGGTLIFESGQSRVLTINASGCGSTALEFESGGTFTRNDGKIIFSDDAEIGGTGDMDLNDVTIQGGVDFNSHNIHGTLEIQSGGYVSDAPLYETGSTLYYNDGAAYGRNTEWSATSGEGYPYNVHVGSGVTLDLGNGGSGTARQLANDLTLDGTLTMASTAMTARLTVKGDILINATGALTLSSSGGGDLNAEGDFTNNGTFTGNSRAVSFKGNGTQTISGGFTGAEGIDYFDIENAHASQGLSLAANLEIDNEVRFKDGYLFLNGFDLIYDADAGNSGTDTPDSDSHIVTNSSGEVTKEDQSDASSFTYAVGPSAGTYTPLTVITGASNTEDDISVRVESGTPTEAGGYAAAAEIYNPTEFVGITWLISEAVAGGMNGDFEFQWPGSVEGGSFSRASGEVWHFDGTEWDDLVEGSRGGADPYTQRSVIPTTLSPFTVGSSTPTVLPIELGDFRSEWVGQELNLHWVTLSELNNDHFVVEKSFDGNNFTTVGQVAGAGTTGEIQHYDLVDEDPYSGPVFYRLTQVDYDGTSVSFPVITVDMSKSKMSNFSAVVYPNPAKSDGIHAQVSGGQPYGAISVIIRDVMGRNLYQSNTTTDHKGRLRETLALPYELPNGWYTLDIKMNGLTSSEPFILNR